MTRLPDGHGGPTGRVLGHGFLTPAIRRDVADLNRQFLTLALEPALARDSRFALPDEVRPTLQTAGESLLERVAACPFTLFQVSLAHGALGGPGPGVEDTRWPLVDAATSGRAQSFSHVAVFLAWRLADAEPLALRVVLGLSAGDELLLNQTRSSDLPRLACAPQLIRPRWVRHPRYWRLLVRAAAAGADATLQRVHCAGICMVVADLWGQEGRSMGRSGPAKR
jgi:hypothetical protein